jgi:hypothetical protein
MIEHDLYTKEMSLRPICDKDSLISALKDNVAQNQVILRGILEEYLTRLERVEKEIDRIKAKEQAEASRPLYHRV